MIAFAPARWLNVTARRHHAGRDGAAAFSDRAVTGRAIALASLVAVGVELALLAAFLPDTVDRFLYGPPADFHNLYQPARDGELAGLYSPLLVLLFQPLALLPEMAAYRAWFAIGVGAAVAIGVWAQVPLRGIEARTAVVLAPLALPQMHWALRLGHLTPVLVLVAALSLAAFARRGRGREMRGALGIALLSLKPQYLIAPLAYFVVARRFLALVIAAAAALIAALLGFAVVGPAELPGYVMRYLDWGSNSADNLLPVQQAWMVSWTGVQISFGSEPHPLITLDLILLSLGVAALAWWRCDGYARAAAIALMLVPLTPYAQFYDGAFVLAAIALLLRCDLPALARAGCVAALYAAAVVTQASIRFPVRDVLGEGVADGPYLLVPAMVAVTALLAFFGAAGRARSAPGPAQEA